MPNWVSNKVKICGKSKDIAELLNSALINSDAEPREDAEDALESLKENAKFSLQSFGLLKPESNKGIRFSTFLPIPKTFLEFDTTNYPEKYPEVCAKQREEYGAIGWYDYNCQYYGCKWDCIIDKDKIELGLYREDEYELSFEVDTPWSCPVAFLKRLKDKFPNLKFFICAVEEVYQILGYMEIGGDEETFDINEIVDERKESELDDASEIAINYVHDELPSQFEEFVFSRV